MIQTAGLLSYWAKLRNKSLKDLPAEADVSRYTVERMQGGAERINFRHTRNLAATLGLNSVIPLLYPPYTDGNTRWEQGTSLTDAAYLDRPFTELAYRLRMSNRKLAERLGVSPTTIHRLDTGEQDTVDVNLLDAIFAFAEQAQMHPDDFFRWHEIEQPPVST